MPSKNFVFLQLFELKDDFIQAEIRKPLYQSVCSHSTGWFSKHMIKTLRFQVAIRFFSLCPNENAKILLRNAHELIERSKKQEALCRSEQSKEDKDVDEEAPAIQTGNEDEIDPNNSDSEDADEEEEEDKDSGGYGSPHMGSPGAAVKLLPCDHEVTGSSPGNSLLQKCKERLRTKDPKWSDPSPDPAQAGATCTGHFSYG